MRNKNLSMREKQKRSTDLQLTLYFISDSLDYLESKSEHSLSDQSLKVILRLYLQDLSGKLFAEFREDGDTSLRSLWYRLQTLGTK